jgi:CheY-like chemotaxis protein
MNTPRAKTIVLADDDADDCILFEDALREVCSESQLTTTTDGIKLMKFLDETVPPPPDVIFLDLNMPRKNGFECLEEIKQIPKLKNIPVIIFSTSSQQEAINITYQKGAHHYVCKPGNFGLLKRTIQIVLSIDWKTNHQQPPKDHFILQ